MLWAIEILKAAAPVVVSWVLERFLKKQKHSASSQEVEVSCAKPDCVQHDDRTG
jgi:hypothetical protein